MLPFTPPHSPRCIPVALQHAPKLDQLLSHTGASMEVCKKYLRESNYDVNLAINKYWDAH